MKSSKEFWKTVQLYQGNNKSSLIGPIKDPQGLLLTDNIQRANAFNSYFTNICSTLNTNGVPRPPSLTNYIYRITPTLPSLTVNQELTYHIVQNTILKRVRPLGLIILTAKCFAYLEIPSFESYYIIAKKSFADCKFRQKCMENSKSTLHPQKSLPVELWKLLSDLFAQ